MDASVQPLAERPLPGPDQLPEELRGSTPRPRPDFVRQSPLAAKRLNILLGCMVAGGMCLVLAHLPFVSAMALYLLPLGYLTWIGLGLCAIGALIYTTGAELKQACKFLEEGEAAFGRVQSLVKKPTLLVHGQSPQYALFAVVEVRHPETGELCLREVKSREFSASKKDRVNTRFRVGDAVPVVWLPHKFDKTVTIYDFLEVSPEAALQWDTPKSSLWQVIAVTAFGVAFLAPFGVFGVLPFLVFVAALLAVLFLAAAFFVLLLVVQVFADLFADVVGFNADITKTGAWREVNFKFTGMLFALLCDQIFIGTDASLRFCMSPFR
jgi:hypothetical protein